VVFVLLLVVVIVVILAVATWQVAPGYHRTLWRRGKPGDIWLHDPTGGTVPDDEEFHKPPNEGDLL